MDEITIRVALPSDVEAIHEIEMLSFSDPWSMDSIRYEIEENPNVFYIVAEHEDGLVGFVGVMELFDEAHILNVAVKPDYRKKKIGEAIIGVLVEGSLEAGIYHHTLEVRKSNEAAIGLYKKFGFEVEGIRKGYYDSGKEDALIMWRHETKTTEG